MAKLKSVKKKVKKMKEDNLKDNLNLENKKDINNIEQKKESIHESVFKSLDALKSDQENSKKEPEEIKKESPPNPGKTIWRANGPTLTELRSSQQKLKGINLKEYIPDLDNDPKKESIFPDLESLKDYLINRIENKDRVDLITLKNSLTSDKDILLEKISILEDSFCNSFKNKLVAERKCRLIKLQLVEMYRKLYSESQEQDDSLLEKQALENIMNSKIWPDNL